MFSYYGTKKKLAKLYPEPKYDTIIEPFAGAAGYSLLYPYKNVILYDTNPKIYAVWKYLISATKQDILNLPNVDKGQKVTDFNLDKEIQWLIGFCINPGSTCPKITASQRTAWNRYKMSIAEQVEGIKHWQIKNSSYEYIPNQEATWHIDPPYQQAGKYYYGYSQMDYNKLGEWCKERIGQVMVCENQGADYLPFQFLTKHQGSMKSNVEVVWYNESESDIDLLNEHPELMKG